MTPDRSAFVNWCAEQFAAADSLKAFWSLVDRSRANRVAMRQEGNMEASAAVDEIVKRAHERLSGAEA